MVIVDTGNNVYAGSYNSVINTFDNFKKVADSDSDSTNIQVSNDGGTVVTFETKLNIYKKNNGIFSLYKSFFPNINTYKFASIQFSSDGCKIITNIASPTILAP
jgi:hypothetical protein